MNWYLTTRVRYSASRNTEIQHGFHRVTWVQSGTAGGKKEAQYPFSQVK